MALVYPNSYYAGMSNLGIHALYRLLNSYPDIVCERVFWEKANSTSGRHPIALESQRPLSDFAVIAFSISYELDYLNIVPILKSSGIPLYATDRDESRILLHLNLGGDETPSLILPKTRILDRDDKPIVEVLFNNQCPWSGWMVDKVRRSMKKFGARFEVVNTDDRAVVEEYGLSRGVCVNGLPVMKRMATVKEVEAVVKKLVPRRQHKSTRRKK